MTHTFLHSLTVALLIRHNLVTIVWKTYENFVEVEGLLQLVNFGLGQIVTQEIESHRIS